MRALLPSPLDDMPSPLDDAELERLYAVPAGTPWLRANMVASLDGAISVQGRSGGLGGPADKQVFALLRDLCDGVLVGAGTVRAEGYEAVKPTEVRLERRRRLGLPDTPVLAVVTARLDLDPASNLFAGPARTTVITTERAWQERGEPFADVADVVTTPGERPDLPAAVAELRRRGLAHLLCEGGPSLLHDVVEAGLLDELCLTLSPRLVGGDAARVLSGPALDPVRELACASLLEQDGFLLSRWVRR